MSQHPTVAAIRTAVTDAVLRLMDLTVNYSTREDRHAAARALADELLLHGIGTSIATGRTEDETLAVVRQIYSEHRQNPLPIVTDKQT